MGIFDTLFSRHGTDKPAATDTKTTTPESANYPSLLARTHEVINSTPSSLQPLARKALLTKFRPTNNPEAPGVEVLSVDSFPEQVKLILAKNPAYNLVEASSNGIAMLVDAKNLKLINDHLGSQHGDQYLLANLESLLALEQKLNAHIIIGRLTGDEIVVLALPHDSSSSLTNLIQKAEGQSISPLEQALAEAQDTHPTIKHLRSSVPQAPEIGCHFAAAPINQVKASKDPHSHRLHTLLSRVITSIEHPHSLEENETSIVPEMVNTLTANRTIRSVDRDKLISSLPSTIKTEYQRIVRINPKLEDQALSLAATASFERLYGEAEVYRADHLREIASELAAGDTTYTLVYFAESNLKSLNKISHEAGDNALQATIRTARDIANSLNSPHQTIFFQSFGSCIALVPQDIAASFGQQLNHLGRDSTIVATPTNILRPDNPMFVLSKENTSSDTNWESFLNDQARPSQYLHEVLEIARRHIDPVNGTTQEGFYALFAVRLQSRLAELSKLFASTFHNNLDTVPAIFETYLKQLPLYDPPTQPDAGTGKITQDLNLYHAKRQSGQHDPVLAAEISDTARLRSRSFTQPKIEGYTNLGLLGLKSLLNDLIRTGHRYANLRPTFAQNQPLP